MPVVVGVDPGKQGAVAVLYPDDSISVLDLTEFYDKEGAAQSSINPTQAIRFLDKLMINRTPVDITLCCERPIFIGGGFTIKTPMSMYESYGVLRGVCSSYGIDFHGVAPREWIQHYPKLYHPKVKRTKEESVRYAQYLFPKYSEVFERKVEKGRSKGNVVLLDGRAEAVLIAKYARDVLCERGTCERENV